MHLLKRQANASPMRGLPVDDKGSSSSIISVSGETVQLYYYTAPGVYTIDAGQAAGTAVVGQLTYDNVKNTVGSMEATKNDTSLTFTSTAFTSEVNLLDYTVIENGDEGTGTGRLTAIVAGLTNGQYVVDYANGTIYGKKADTSVTLTSAAYKYKTSATSSAGGSTTVTGNAASGATDSGNPVKVGLKVNVTSPTFVDGQRADLQGDINGYLKDREQYVDQFVNNSEAYAAVVIKPQTTATASWTLFTNFGANATLNVKTTSGNIKSIVCHNLNAAVRFIQIFNTATVPSAGNVPILAFPVAASGGVTVIDGQTLGENGYNFSTGIAFAFSTTEATYTAGTAADQFTHIFYK